VQELERAVHDGDEATRHIGEGGGRYLQLNEPYTLTQPKAFSQKLTHPGERKMKKKKETDWREELTKR
jgi:hypothetical protein